MSIEPTNQSSKARVLSEAELAYERLGDEFSRAISDYDTTRRVEVLVDDFLDDSMLRGRCVLDVGCGLGHFSLRLVQRGAEVVACDIAPTLVEKTRERAGCQAVVADALRLVAQFGAGSFDGVVSSECIEHTPRPHEAVRQMVEVVKPGGFISISTPNILWSPVIKLATRLRLRPFNGLENLSSWRRLRRVLESYEAPVVREYGLHLFPFQFGFTTLSQQCDRRLQVLRGGMINICMLAIKK